MKGPEYSKESSLELVLQSPEVDEVLLLDGEGASLEVLVTMAVFAGMVAVVLAVVGDSGDPQGPH